MVRFTTPILKFLAKVGIVGGAVYYSKESGIWKDSRATENIYKNTYSLVMPYVKEIPVEIPELPKVETLSMTSKSLWNHGVLSAATFMTEIPDHVISISKKGQNFILSLFEESDNSKVSSQ